MKITPPSEKETRERNYRNTVNGEEKNDIKKLKDLDQPKERSDYVAQHILSVLGDEKSERFYKLVAAKIPEQIIRETLSEIKVDGARNPAKVFVYRVKKYALTEARRGLGKTF
jgi:hypothetical protein